MRHIVCALFLLHVGPFVVSETRVDEDLRANLDFAVQQVQDGRMQSGLRVLEAVLATQTDSVLVAEALNVLGVVRSSLGDLDGAAESMLESLRLRRSALTGCNLIEVLRRLGRVEEALHLGESFVSDEQLLLDGEACHVNLALTLSDIGNNPRAIQLLVEATERFGESANTLSWLGRIYVLENLWEEAHAVYSVLVSAEESSTGKLSFGTAHGMAMSLHKNGYLFEAERYYEHAQSLNPEHKFNNVNFAALLHQQGRSAESADLHETLVAKYPEDPLVRNNFGAALQTLGRYDEAIEQLETSLRLEPTSLSATVNLGNHFHSAGYQDLAREYFHRARDLAAGVTEEASMSSGQFFCVSSCPGGYLLRSALLIPQVMQSTDAMAAHRMMMVQEMKRLYDSIRNGSLAHFNPRNYIENVQFYLPYHGMHDRMLQETIAQIHLFIGGHALLVKAGPWLESRMEPPAKAIGKPLPALAAGLGRLSRGVQHTHGEAREEGRVRHRIVFVSKFFGVWEPHGLLLKGIITALPREHFEVIIAPIPSPPKPLDAELAEAADGVLPLGLDHDGNLKTLADCGADIMVYADMNSEPITHFLGFARLAPLQMVFWGNPVTTGNPSIDYFVSGDRLEFAKRTRIGPDLEPYTEQVVLLGGQGIWYEAPILYSQDDDDDAGPDFDLPKNRTIYFVGQSIFKIHPLFDEAVVNILSRDQTGVVVFLAGHRPKWTELLQQRLLPLARSRCSSCEERIRFVPRQGTPRGYQRLLSCTDIVLHPFPFGGSRTSADAISQGIPMVIFPTMALRGRMAASFYSTMSDELVSRLIAADLDDYVAKAVHLAKDPEYYEETRSIILATSWKVWNDTFYVSEWIHFLSRASGVLIEGRRSHVSYYDALDDNIPLSTTDLEVEATAMFRQGNLPRAAELLHTCIKIAPYESRFWNDLGSVLHQSGRIEASYKIFKRGFELDPSNQLLLSNLAMVSASLGRFQEAVDLYKDALAVNLDDITLSNFANLYRDKREHEMALKTYVDYLELPPLDEGGAYLVYLAVLDERDAVSSEHILASLQQVVQGEGIAQASAKALMEKLSGLRQNFPVSVNGVSALLSIYESSPTPEDLYRLISGIQAPPSGGFVRSLKFLSRKPGIVLIAQYFMAGRESRQLELDAVLRQNLENPYVEEIHLLLETQVYVNFKASFAFLADATELMRKVTLHHLGKRMTFADVFNYANENLQGRLVGLVNADIVFDSTIYRLGDAQSFNMERRILALLRQELVVLDSDQTVGTRLVPRTDSQDAWIFRAPVPQAIVAASDFQLGLPRCDVRLAQVFSDNGYTVHNPAFAIHAIHVHFRENATMATQSGAGVRDHHLELGAYKLEGQVLGAGMTVPISLQWLF